MRIAVLDIGGTSIKSGIWDGQVLREQQEWETQAKKGGAHLLERVISILHTCTPFDAIGISTAGQVDTARGSIYYANDNIPGYTGMEIKQMLEKKFQVPVAVENDVNSAALGELRYGAGQGNRDFLCLTYGTGVGGAIVLEEKVYTGAAFSAGSFGGIVIHPEKMNPEEEFSGCYEKCASATALVNAVKTIDSSLDNGRKIFEAFACPEVRECIDQWIDEVVYGLVSLTHIFNPSLILLGGGIMGQEYIIAEVRKRLNKFISPGFRKLEIRQTQLGNRAGMMGAVWLAERCLTNKYTLL